MKCGFAINSCLLGCSTAHVSYSNEKLNIRIQNLTTIVDFTLDIALLFWLAFNCISQILVKHSVKNKCLVYLCL